MGKARIQGSSAELYIIDPSTGNPVYFGEYTKCTVKDLGELKKKQSLGQKSVTSQYEFRGYDIDLEGDKVDWSACDLIYAQQKQAYGGGRSPQITIRNKVTYYDGSVKAWDYPNCTLHGYEEDFPSENDVTEKMMAFCGELKVENEATTNKSTMDSVIAGILGKMTEKGTNDTGTGYAPKKQF